MTNFNTTEDLVSSAFDGFSEEIEENSRTNDEIAFMAADATSKLTGEDKDILFEQNKRRISMFGQQKVKDETSAISEESFRAEARESIKDALVVGDTEQVQRDLAFLTGPEESDFEVTVAALLAIGKTSPEKISSVASQMKVRDTYSKILNRLEQKSGFWSAAFDIVNDLIPAKDNRAFNNIVEKALGTTEELGYVFTDVEHLNAVRDVFYSLESKEQEEFLLSLETVSIEESGVIGENATEALRFFKTILEGNAEDISSNNFWAGFDIAAVIPIVTLSRMVTSIKAADPVGVYSQLGDEVASSTTVAKNIVGDDNLLVTPSSDLVEYSLSLGKSPLTLEGQVLEGASEELKKALSEQAASREVKEIIETTGHTGVDENTLNQLIDKYKDHLHNAEASSIRSIEVLRADDLGIDANVLIQDAATDTFFKSRMAAEATAKRLGLEKYSIIEEGSENFAIKTTSSKKWTTEDIGTFDTDIRAAVNWLPNWLQFPLQSLDKTAVTTRVLGIKKEDAMRGNFIKLHDEAFSGLSAKQEAKVYHALAKGDSRSLQGGQGTVFNPQQLSAMDLSIKEQEAYYKIRTLRDLSWVVHNKAARDNLEFLGFSEISFKGNDLLDPFVTPGRAISVEAARSLISGDVKKYAYSSVIGQPIELTKDVVAALYKEGQELIRLANPKKMGDSEHSLLIVNSSKREINNLNTVIPYRAGEFSRQYQDPWFVYFTSDGFKNGVKEKFTKTFMTSPTKKDAKRFAIAHNKAMDVIKQAVKAGEINGVLKSASSFRKVLSKEISDFIGEWGNSRYLVDDVLDGEKSVNTRFDVKFDREVPTSVSDKEGIEIMFNTGRALTGKRGDTLRRVDGTPAPIKSVKESLANELSYVSRFVNIAKWREGQIQRLINTFKGRIKGPNGATKYEVALHGELVGEWSTAERDYLKRMRAHINTQIGLPTEEAIHARAKMKDFASWLEGKGALGERAAYKMYDWRSVSPSQSLRAAVFHSYLGLGNLAQFLVQANGMAMAASIHPIHGLKSAMSYPLVRLGVMFDSIDNQKALGALTKKIDYTTLGITNEKEFMEIVKLVRSSSVLNDIKSSALYFVKEGAVDIGSDMDMYTKGFSSTLSKAARKTLDLGLQPFNRGEEMARVVSLDIARREWKKLNPGKDALSRQGVNEILAMQEKYTIGMSRANIGRIQQGWLATPFQFAQYNWKLMESLLGKTFTPKEKARLMTGMTLLYGAEGMGASWAFNEVFGSKDINMSKEEKIATTQGMISWAMYKASGAETALGSRLGPGTYFESLFNNIFDGDIAVWEFLAGPSSSFLTKEWEAGKDIIRIFSSTDSLDYETSKQSFFRMMEGVSSGWSNTTKYLMAMNGDGWLRTKSGVRNVPLSDLEAMLGIFGFKSLKEVETSKGFKIVASLSREKKELAKSYATLINKYNFAETDSERENLYQQIQAFRHSLPRGMFYDIHRSAWSSITRENFFDYYKRKVTEAIDTEQTKAIRITE